VLGLVEIEICPLSPGLVGLPGKDFEARKAWARRIGAPTRSCTPPYFMAGTFIFRLLAYMFFLT
jgi:hypothetical protein